MTAEVPTFGHLADLLAAFTDVPAPPGHEEALGALVSERWQNTAPVSGDRLGNRWCTVGDGSDHIVVLAHLDEVALVVRKIDPDGYLRVHRVGGIPERVLMGQAALVLGRDGPVSGVFGTVAHHFASEADKGHVVPADDQYLDIGAESAADARQRLGVDVGNFIVYERTFRLRGDDVWANAIDDRAGLVAATALLERLTSQQSPRRVTVLASVQEEFSLRGLLPAVRALSPDLIISVDIAPACDTPDLFGRSDVALGSGPVVNHYSFHGRGTLAGVIPPRWLTDKVHQAADANGIPTQPAAFFGGLTDASFAQLEGEGATALEVGIPCRYTHSPIERCRLSDVATAVDLLERIVHDVPTRAPTTKVGNTRVEPVVSRVTRPKRSND